MRVMASHAMTFEPSPVGTARLILEPLTVQHADEMVAVLASPELQADLKEKGLARAELFSWDRCARMTLDIIESVARDGRS